MHDSLKTREQLLEEVAALRARLEEPEETLSAIHSGQIDAFVVLEAAGEKVYTLATAELLRQLQVITDSLPVAVAYLDRERRYHFNSRLHESWFGRPRHEITGRSMVEVMGEAMYEAVREKVDAALNGNQVAFEQWLNFPGTGSRCIHFTLIPHVHAEKVQGFVAFVQDTSERRRAEEALRLLADSGKLLADSPGGESMLADAARLVVPALADWCAFELAEESGGRRVVSVHADPTIQPGQAAPCSRLDIPLLAHGRTLGTWSFIYAASDRRHREEDREIAQELARRVAVALDNSRLYRDLEAANRAKDHFLATLSHELRTPLTPVLAMASRLQADDDLPAGVRAGVTMIRRNVELEARLIDDLLDLTRISRGKLELHCEPTDLRQVIQHAFETCDERELGTRRVVQELAAEEHLVWGDPSRLSQVFWNLLSNALKFTPPGGTIALRSYREAPEGAAAKPGASQQLVIEVSDSGVGVDPEALPGIFDAFDQGEAGTGRRFGGLGLGLAISRAIVDLHGGRLTAQSAGRNRGTTFTMRLPLSVATSGMERTAEGAVQRPWRDSAAPRALHVLVVEDHADTAEAVATLLQAIGHRVRVARTVAAALAAAESSRPDLVISDLGLPDGDGDDLMRELASRYPGLRGIALSGYGMEADVARSRDAGFAVHLVKPVTLEDLRAAVQRLGGPATAGD
jgi:two-component system CheB/CheR fusion protein